MVQRMSKSKLVSHLYSRHLKLEEYTSIIVGDDLVYFLLYSLTGKLVGYQQYNYLADKIAKNHPREGRYFTYVTSEGTCKANSVWGLDRLDSSKTELYVVEGVFKACRLHNLGLNCVAVLGNNPKSMYNWFYSLPYKIIPICDGDKGGKALGKLTSNSIYLKDGQYLDEMTVKDIKEVIYE